RRRTEEILSSGSDLEKTLANYDSPQGKQAFLESLAGLLNREFGWNLSSKNIAVTNGSQNASFLLLNLLGGTGKDGIKRKVLFPLCPEYIGYADQSIEEGSLATRPAKIELTRPGFFKYHVDFENLGINPEISALCISRPTNPTGNVLTDDEVARLAEIAREKNIPFIIDNAYGAPFPHILFRDVKPYWDENVILSMSLSKLGLPAVRTGIIIAEESIIQAVTACNAVISLANGSVGQVLVRPLIDSGDILRISRDVIRPFYKARSESAIAAIEETFGSDIPYRIHESEGSIFLWLWLPDLPIKSAELYKRLKARGVLVISGHYFFYGLDHHWAHADECLRLSYALDPVKFKEAAVIMADEIRRVMNEANN
ncbi:MAG: valine--pyruvate transaminase, partial [Spirochaetaceae bacterium]|nr:valine--pyruvate transaminase [Spirochaetaceae bacterium]